MIGRLAFLHSPPFLTECLGEKVLNRFFAEFRRLVRHAVFFFDSGCPHITGDRFHRCFEYPGHCN